MDTAKRRQILGAPMRIINPYRYEGGGASYPAPSWLHWDFSAGGTPLVDTEQGITLQLYNSASIDSGTLYISAANDHARTTTNVPLIVFGSPWTIMIDVTPLSLSGSYCYFFGNFGGNGFLKHTSVSSKWGIFMSSLKSANDTLTVSNRTKLLVSTDGSNLLFYRDGATNGSASGSAYLGSTIGYVGSYNNGGLNEAMRIHSFSVWNSQLSDADSKAATTP